eukprot:TRINITY_DN4571_c0_g2_i4.p1 TRINITY_DN4571_c0_g2~~TRINITY_DN4571_c0_g2_i4.p1  ORF type:complete len:327 (+),score=91.26 TRINITY_DN4571_c0_g2_i4:122-1102(+)
MSFHRRTPLNDSSILEIRKELNELKQNSIEFGEFSDQLTHLEQRYTVLMEDKQRIEMEYRRNIEKANKELIASNIENEQLADQIKGKDAENDILKATIRGLREQIDAKSMEISRHKQELREVTQKLHDLNVEHKKSVALLDSREREVVDLNRLNNTLRAELERVLREQGKLSEKIREKEYFQAVLENDFLQKNDYVDRERNEKNEKIRSLERRVTEASDLIREMERALVELKSEKGSLTKEISTLNEQLQKERQQSMEHKSKIDLREIELKKRDDQIENLKRELSQVEKTYSSASFEITNYRQENEDLRSQVSQWVRKVREVRSIY